MAGCLRVAVLLLLVTGTLTQDEFNLFDALEPTTAPTPAKPKEQPKAPEKPKEQPKAPEKPKEQPKAPEKPKSEGFDLSHGLDETDPQPTPGKPAVKPPSSGGGGSFGDGDLLDVSGGDYKPDGGHQGGGGAGDSGYNQGGADEPQDPELLWGQILKTLNANMPEEFLMWISNLKKALTPLLERAMDLLQAAP
ncbi:CD99 molecule isoform X4 [Pungitius pungitius]|uniref:CD99 molecule isoform X4 n=1 Tax=Pungitius pungitius TaxID=134920 RepID=UPI002E14416E